MRSFSDGDPPFARTTTIAAGLVISTGGSAFLGVMPSLGIVIGGVLVLVGLWMLVGGTLHSGAFGRFAGRVGDPRNVSVSGFFLFGLPTGRLL